MSSFAIYFIGGLIFVAGLAYGATILGVPPIFTGIGVLILLGLIIMMGVGKTREKDDTEASD